MEFEANKTKSLPFFLKAAKSSPSNPVSFLYLGHIYRDSGDLDKARKCYLKSFQLDPAGMDAARELSDVYRKQGEIERNLELLKSITAASSAASTSLSRQDRHNR